jgi:hypothetical protein
VLFKNLVAIAGLGIEAHGVRQAGAATALYTHAQTTELERNAVFLEERANFASSALGEGDFRDGRSSYFRGHNIAFHNVSQLLQTGARRARWTRRYTDLARRIERGAEKAASTDNVSAQL